MFEKKEALSAVRNLYPCVHSGDFYGIDFANVAPCRYRGCPDNNIGLHADENVDTRIERGMFDESSSNETSEIFSRDNKSNL